LLLANPPLSRTISGAIGDRWISNLDELRKPQTVGRPTRTYKQPSASPNAKAKVKFADWLKSTTGQDVDPDTISDCQVKRIHEYKRQLLNAPCAWLWFIPATPEPQARFAPRTFIFAGRRRPPTNWPS